MRVLFFTKMNFALQGMSGIRQKIWAQTEAFQTEGHETDLAFREGNIFKTVRHTGETVEIPLPAGPSKLAVYYREMPEKLGLAQYDVLYLRHHLAVPGMLGLMRRFKKANPKGLIFIEFPTFPYAYEYVKPVDRVKVWVDLWCARAFKRYADYMVSVTPQTEIYGVPALVIGNGISLNGIPFQERPPVLDGELRLLGLANVQRWHGFDRLIAGLATYRAQTPAIRVTFDIAGKGDELPKLEAQVKALGLGEVVRFHGFLTGKALDELVANAHLAISSLGMHRIQMGAGSVLKSREYCARGKPFVYAFTDESLPEGFPYACLLPANETPIEVPELLFFYQKLLAEHPNFSEAMRRFAAEKMSWQAVMRPVFEKLA